MSHGLRAQAYIGLDSNLPFRTDSQAASIWVNVEIRPTAGLIRVSSDPRENRHDVVVADMDRLGLLTGKATSVIHLARSLFAALNLAANRALFAQTLRDPGTISVTRNDETQTASVDRDADGNVTIAARATIHSSVGLRLGLEASEEIGEDDVIKGMVAVFNQRKGDPNEIADGSKAIASFTRIAESTTWPERLSNAHACMEHALGNDRLTGVAKDIAIASITGQAEADIATIRRIANRLKHADGSNSHADAQLLAEFLKSPTKIGQASIQAARAMVRDTLQIRQAAVP